MDKKSKTFRHCLSLGPRTLHPIVFVCVAALAFCVAGPGHAEELAHASTLPDLSGLAWVEDDLFLGVHDAKRDSAKYNWPRVSFLRLPKSELQGVTWQPLDLEFPGPEGRSSDLESASRIPGEAAFLLAESGQEGSRDRRIFYAEYDNGALRIASHTVWPVDIKNVEATAVHRLERQLLFLYAERAEGLPSTKLRWATLFVEPLAFGAFSELTFESIDPVGRGARPIVALDVDSDGLIYVVSAYDPGSDNGPYRSVVWRVGKIFADNNGSPQISLFQAERLANLDGLKVESIAVRETKEGGKEIYVGTDDEHYGGILRLLPHSD